MKKIIVASKNPAKIQAVVVGFERMFPDEKFIVEGAGISSGVSDQPASDAETYQGAYNRTLNARQVMPEADFWVGLEGGVETQDAEMQAYAWVVVLSKNGQTGKGKTGVYVLPPKVAELVRSGEELGRANDIVFGTTNSKHTSGAVGLLTHDLIDRAEYYAEAVIFALIPFRNPELYSLELLHGHLS